MRYRVRRVEHLTGRDDLLQRATNRIEFCRRLRGRELARVSGRSGWRRDQVDEYRGRSRREGVQGAAAAGMSAVQEGAGEGKPRLATEQFAAQGARIVTRSAGGVRPIAESC